MHELSDRVPGQAVITKLLDVREQDAERSLLGRFFGANPLSADSLPWYRGALGEMAVGRLLAALGPEWTVLHAVPVGTGNSDIDHVLIGPAGVFTLNTKNHSDQPVWVAGRTLMVAGQRTRHIPNAAHEAARAGKLLAAASGVPVNPTGVVVVIAPRSLTIKKKPDGAKVLTDRQLLRWLRGLPPALPADQVFRLVSAARAPRTWHRNPVPQGDPVELQHRFNSLRDVVERARRRRLLWVLAAFVGFFTVTVGNVFL
ncbi:nuclease-related domain-containing protein [Arthrobacter sp. B10-11]|uniref:nuclease-related domain-containing protein n=1 Tax=Arthrobacter sp. B10-11 TaxID=3081160 RepID=UPI002954608B|nr:nuclease-related domain-containing protein [Arthrobacter sp. B10-11]MDV8148919.1 nuclease-related domain-containing protein [Arthrobacter sp. B10-11]